MQVSSQGDPRLLKVTTRADLELVAVVAVKAVVFDVGETLVDETAHLGARGRPRRRAALHGDGSPRRLDRARGEHHSRVWELLGVDRPGVGRVRAGRSLSRRPAVPRELRARGLARRRRREHAAVDARSLLETHVDFVGSSARWGVEKPAPEFFERSSLRPVARRGEIAYVGDRVDNDVVPALRRGWSPSTSAEGRGAICTSRRPQALRDRLARRAAGGARCLTCASGSASTRTRFAEGVPLVLGGVAIDFRAGSPATPTAT